jgi:hypothetical protein
VLGRGYVEGGAVVVIARLPFQVKLQGPVLGAGGGNCPLALRGGAPGSCAWSRVREGN